MRATRFAAVASCWLLPAATGCSAAPEPVGAVEWFGFVGVGCGVDDPHDDAGPSDYLGETAGFTNLAHVCVFDPDVTDDLAATRSAGVHALLDVSALLWEQVDGAAPSGSGRRSVLRADAADAWADFARRNQTVLDAEHVAAIYLVDEPTWNGATQSDLDRAAAIVDTTLPLIPMVVIEAPDALANAYFPAQVDWVGFDRYATRDPNIDAGYLDNARTLRARSSEEQRQVVVMDTQWLPWYADAGLTEEDMAVVARNYVRYAHAHDDVVAIVGYSWPGGIDGPEHLGARDLPESVRDTLRRIGQGIVAP